ncbi:serine threonine kinase [Babesia ovata]|uniref:Serine threonine kinase n=1 Tax=Babesia ovata TaxID=189622 RepID=A0A2H6K7E3_9APIC|nr:serine threonine kinase [Babesia ovata]GBE58917.1 serine threonine kinase [Babesia ovata]
MCGFNFVVFQFITAHLKGDPQYVELLPERIPTAHTACFACSIVHLIAMLISLAYLRGYIKFDPFERPMRFIRSTVGLSPVSGPMRYRKITENGTALPESSNDADTDCSESHYLQ